MCIVGQRSMNVYIRHEWVCIQICMYVTSQVWGYTCVFVCIYRQTCTGLWVCRLQENKHQCHVSIHIYMYMISCSASVGWLRFANEFRPKEPTSILHVAAQQIEMALAQNITMSWLTGCPVEYRQSVVIYASISVKWHWCHNQYH